MLKYVYSPIFVTWNGKPQTYVASTSLTVSFQTIGLFHAFFTFGRCAQWKLSTLMFQPNIPPQHIYAVGRVLA